MLNFKNNRDSLFPEFFVCNTWISLSVWYSFIYACHVNILVGCYTVWFWHIYATEKVDLLHSNTDRKAKWPTIWFTKFLSSSFDAEKKELLLLCDYSFMTMLWYGTLYDNIQLEKNRQIWILCFLTNRTKYISMISVEWIIYKLFQTLISLHLLK